MRKTLQYEADLATCERVIALAVSNEDRIEEYTGSLLDNYIIKTDTITFGRVKPRKYIIFEETFVNTQSSKYVVTLTDDVKIVSEVMDKYENELEREDI